MLHSLDFTSQIYENTTNSLALFIATAFIVTIKKNYCNFLTLHVNFTELYYRTLF